MRKREDVDEYHKEVQIEVETNFISRFISRENTSDLSQLDERLSILDKVFSKKFSHEKEKKKESSRMKKYETINVCIKDILDMISGNNASNIKQILQGMNKQTQQSPLASLAITLASLPDDIMNILVNMFAY